jgi:chromosome segregation ATPase
VESAESLVATGAQSRATELEQQLEEVRSNLNDLIGEIEEVASAEEKARLQCLLILKQMDDMQSKHKGVIEENINLLEQISSLQQKISVYLSK